MTLTTEQCLEKGLRRSSFPSDKGGAWLVRRISDGWVDLVTADFNWVQRIPIDKLNRLADELNAIKMDRE